MTQSDALEQLRASAFALEGQPDRGQLGLDIGRPWERPIVGLDPLATSHSDGELTLVVGLMGVELGTGRVAGDPEAVGHAQSPIADQVGRCEPDALEADVVEREGPSDGQQRLVTLGARPVIEVDNVGAVAAGAVPCSLRPDAEPDKVFIDLWLALATPPAIGESLVGQRIYEGELAKLGPDDDLLFIGASGLYSYKGTEWRRSGVFERIELVQGDRTIRLRSEDHLRIDTLAAAGSPELREIGLFRIARSTGFDATLPFRFSTIAFDGSYSAGSKFVMLLPCV